MSCETVRQSAQIIPVRKSMSSSLEVFVGFRKTTSFNGMWCSPGENLDCGETPLAAAVRELYEETNALVWADQLEFYGRQLRALEGECIRSIHFC